MSYVCIAGGCLTEISVIVIFSVFKAINGSIVILSIYKEYSKVANEFSNLVFFNVIFYLHYIK